MSKNTGGASKGTVWVLFFIYFFSTVSIAASLEKIPWWIAALLIVSFAGFMIRDEFLDDRVKYGRKKD